MPVDFSITVSNVLCYSNGRLILRDSSSGFSLYRPITKCSTSKNMDMNWESLIESIH